MAASEALRLSEIRALDLGDYADGRLRVARTIQGPRLDAPIVEWTKNDSGEWRELWFEPLREWIERRLAQATPERRLRGEVALCWNLTARNAAKRWAPHALEREWHRTRKAAGVPCVLPGGHPAHHSHSAWREDAGADAAGLLPPQGPPEPGQVLTSQDCANDNHHLAARARRG